jgi:tetratricopeptide (TPR) repeat protein
MHISLVYWEKRILVALVRGACVNNTSPMPNTRLGRIAASTGFLLLIAISLATNAYVAHRIVYPPRTLRVRIVSDPSNPPLPGIGPATLKARVEALSGFFQQATGIRLTVTGFSKIRLPPQTFGAETLRRFIDVKTPREDADILIAFWAAPPASAEIGAALPYSAVAVVRIEGDKDESRDRAVLAHQILTLFGVPASADTQSVMHLPPANLRLDPASADDLNEMRLFDFSRGIGGMSRRMRSRVLNVLARDGRNDPEKLASRAPRMLLADLYARDGQLPAAIEQYRMLIRADARHFSAHLGLAQALAQSGQAAQAEEEARLAIQLSPAQADPHYVLAYAMVRAGNPEGAIPEFRKAIEIQPGSIRNRTGLAVGYAASIGEFDAADREFQQALQMDPQNRELQADIDFVNRLRARLNKQREAAEANVQMHPASGPAHEALAILLLRLGLMERSLTEVREALKLGPDTWHPHYTLALALYARHDYAGSAVELAAAKRLGSGSRPFLEDSLRAAASPQ